MFVLQTYSISLQTLLGPIIMMIIKLGKFQANYKSAHSELSLHSFCDIKDNVGLCTSAPPYKCLSMTKKTDYKYRNRICSELIYDRIAMNLENLRIDAEFLHDFLPQLY